MLCHYPLRRNLGEPAEAVREAIELYLSACLHSPRSCHQSEWHHMACTLLPIRINRSPGTRSVILAPGLQLKVWNKVESGFDSVQHLPKNWKSMKKQPKHIWQGSNSTTLTLNLQTIRKKGNKLCYIKWRPLCDNKKIEKKLMTNSENMFETYVADKRLIFLIKRVWEKKGKQMTV